jgi:hypothetical protein
MVQRSNLQEQLLQATLPAQPQPRPKKMNHLKMPKVFGTTLAQKAVKADLEPQHHVPNALQ